MVKEDEKPLGKGEDGVDLFAATRKKTICSMIAAASLALQAELLPKAAWRA